MVADRISQGFASEYKAGPRASGVAGRIRQAGAWLAMAAALSAGGCESVVDGAPATFLAGPDYPSQLDVVGMVGTKLSYHPFRVFAHRAGRPVSGLPIEWAVSDGGGSISPAQDVTREGASVATLTLGPVEGTYTVTATAPTLPGPPRYTFKEVTAVTRIVQARDLGDGGFVPGTVTVPMGKSVGWIYSSGEGDVHNVTFEDNPVQPTSSGGLWQLGRIYHFRVFAGPPRTVRYRCTYHSTSFSEGEVGTVVVTELQETESPGFVSNPVLGLLPNGGAATSMASPAQSSVAVVATLWPVADQATADLMERFYEAPSAVTDPARALAKTQRSLIAPPATAQSFYRAGFVAAGGADGRAP